MTPRVVRGFLRDIAVRKERRWARETINAALSAGLARPGDARYPYKLTRAGMIELGIYEG